MKLVWTKSNSPLSIFIRAVTGDDCSHFAIVLYDGKPGEIMFESNLLGTHPAFYKNSLKNHTIVHLKEIECTDKTEDHVWDQIVEIYDGHGYDFLGALYLGYCKLMWRWFKKPLPQLNLWASSSKFFCDEVFEALNGVSGIPEIPVANGMKTPHDVWECFQSGGSNG